MPITEPTSYHYRLENGLERHPAYTLAPQWQAETGTVGAQASRRLGRKQPPRMTESLELLALVTSPATRQVPSANAAGAYRFRGMKNEATDRFNLSADYATHPTNVELSGPSSGHQHIAVRPTSTADFGPIFEDATEGSADILDREADLPGDGLGWVSLMANPSVHTKADSSDLDRSLSWSSTGSSGFSARRSSASSSDTMSCSPPRPGDATVDPVAPPLHALALGLKDTVLAPISIHVGMNIIPGSTSKPTRRNVSVR